VTYISQCSVATHVRCGEILIDDKFTADSDIKEFFKQSSFWRSYEQQCNDAKKFFNSFLMLHNVTVMFLFSFSVVKSSKHSSAL